MAANVRFNDASQTVIQIGVTRIQGFTGDGWILERRSPEYTIVRGLGGAVVPVRSTDRTSYLKLNVLKTSPANGELSVLRTAGNILGGGEVPILIADLITGERYWSPSCICTQSPKAGIQGPYVWEFCLYETQALFGQDIPWVGDPRESL